MNPIGVPSPERPHAHESLPDGTALRSDAEWDVVTRESQGNLAEARHPWAAWRNRFAVHSCACRRWCAFVFGTWDGLRCSIPSPKGLNHAAQECRAIARLSRGTPHHPRSPPVHEPHRGSVTRTSPRPRIATWRDRVAVRCGMGGVWHANPKGASPRLGTLGLHDGTALRSNAEW